jgi:hypothetical protein
VWGLPLDSLICAPYSWLEVSLQPKGLATAHFDQGFSMFLLDPVTNIELLRRLYFALHAYLVALPTSTSEFPPETTFPKLLKLICCLSTAKFSPDAQIVSHTANSNSLLQVSAAK